MTNQGARDFIKFGLVGICSTAADIGLLAVLNHVGVSKYLAVFLAYLTGAVIGYLLNNNWTYKHLAQKNSWSGFSRFATIAFIGLGITELIIFALTTRSSLALLLAKLIATVVVFFWNFFANRLLTFKGTST